MSETRPTESTRGATSRLSLSRARVQDALGRTTTGLRESDAARWITRASRRVGAWLAPVTPLGWAAAAIAVVSITAGLVLGWREHVITGAIAAIVLVTASLFVLGQARYRVDIDLEFTRVVVGERALGQIEIESMSAKQLMPTSIEVPVGSALAIFDLPRMVRGDVHEDIFVIPTERRGVLLGRPGQVGQGRCARPGAAAGEVDRPRRPVRASEDPRARRRDRGHRA